MHPETVGAEKMNMNVVDNMPVEQEIIASREKFYVPVSLTNNDIFCGDERQPIDVATDYIHWFGGALNVPYNLAIMKETIHPGSVTDTFEEQTGSLVPVLLEAGVQGGVHSDACSEQGDRMRIDNPEGAVGCGYGQKRPDISRLIADPANGVAEDALRLRPELFESQQDVDFADNVIESHGRLAEREGFFTSGRRVILTAVAKGAKSMLVAGEHSAKEGIINLDPESTLRSGEAMNAGLPAYNHDSWAIEETYDMIHHLYPYDKRQLQIAELIDTIGTMRALGVEDIAVRRPQAEQTP